MEFVQGKEGYCEEEEEMIGNKGKLPFSPSSSSSSLSYSHQYKGVIPPSSRRWGAQIYEKPQRIWSGTSEVEKEAARSYDQDSLRYCSHDAVNNFKQKIDLMDFSPMRNNDAMERQEDVEAAGDPESGGGGAEYIEREHMFDKVVTPSDVGKLNRLVIPKQHAEKYFPLDSSTNEKGLLLNFEDLSGKSWRFRYSYWNSSQSYVMTKGWSRFVKEKKLDAGDVISFERGVAESCKDRLYIDWRRRPDAPNPSLLPHRPLPFMSRSLPWGRLFLPSPTVPVPHLNYDNLHHRTTYSGSPCGYNVVNPGGLGSVPVFYLRSSSAPQQVGVVQQVGDVPMVFDSVPVVHGKAAAKRLRLFGVNMECSIQEDSECDKASLPPHPQASPLPPLQLRLCNGNPLPAAPTELPNKGKASLSLDLDI